MRGYFGVGIENPKFNENISHALRACGCFDADFLAVSGKRYSKTKIDTQRAYRHFPFFQVDNLIDFCPYNCIPVAVEIVDNAKNLNNFAHPERAFYIFGQEDGSISQKTLDACQYKVYIPTRHCLNLAATVNIVLYDRLSKLEIPKTHRNSIRNV